MSLSRTVALSAALLCVGLNAGAQEPRRFDVFAGGGVVLHEVTDHTVQVGGGVWAGQHLRLGARLENGVWLGLFAHLRLPISEDVDLLAGTTTGWATRDLGFYVAPTAEGFVSKRVSPRGRLEFGMSFYLGEGGFFYPMGRFVYSFD